MAACICKANGGPQRNGQASPDVLELSSKGTPIGKSGTSPIAKNANSHHHIPKAPLQIPIAICSRALRLPGGLRTPQQFWDFLLAKGEARSRVPQSRYPRGKPASASTEYGYFLDDNVSLASSRKTPRLDVEGADPQLRLLLEVVRECIEDAGESNWRGRPVGCYISNFGEERSGTLAKAAQPPGVTGHGDCTLSSQISHEMGFLGPR